MSTQRDRYQNHTYSESRDRGRAEHARQDLADAPVYNGRAVLADVAERHGWTVAGPINSGGLDYVFYENGSTRFVIGWTPQNTAPCILRGTMPGSDTTPIHGPCGLIKVRNVIEGKDN